MLIGAMPSSGDPGRATYFDHAASTPVWPVAIDAMAPWWGAAGNPHATQHGPGLSAQKAVRGAARDLASLFGALPAGVIFTSGATEANTLAVLGAGRSLPKNKGILIGAGDHACVQVASDILEGEGRRVHRLGLLSSGLPDLAALAGLATREDIGLVSMMAVNNEVGAMPDLEGLGATLRKKGILFHVDAAQAPWRCKIDMRAAAVDLLTVSGHKIGAPPGIGALIRGQIGPRIQPLIPGAGQQSGIRGGTVPVPLVMGLGAIARVIAEAQPTLAKRLSALEAAFLDPLQKTGSALNGPPLGSDDRAAGIVSVKLPVGLSAEGAMAALPDLALATGAACSANRGRPSRSLVAMGLDADAASRTLRISFAPFQEIEDVATAGQRLADWILGAKPL